MHNELTYVGLPCVSPNLGNEKVYTERCIFVLKVFSNIIDAALKILWGLAKPTNDTNTT